MFKEMLICCLEAKNVRMHHTSYTGTIVAHEELVRGLHAPYVKNEIIYVYIPFIKNKMSRSVFWRIDRSGF